MIPSGLSPPDFSAMKVEKEDEQPLEKIEERRQESLLELSPLLNLTTPPFRFRPDDKLVIPLARKLNFSE